MKDLRFGIEIETLAASRRTVGEAIHSVVGGTIRDDGSTFYDSAMVTAPDGRVWKVVHDGSLRGQGVGCEIVSPVLGYADIETLQEVVRAVRRAGASVNETCGIHVHVEMVTLTPKQITNLIKMIYKQEAIIEAALGIIPSRKRYCASISPEFIAKLESRRTWTLQTLNEAWYGFYNPRPARYDQSRYHGVNLNSIWRQDTIEFRWANSTLHAGQVKTYVQFALALVGKAKAARSAQSAKRVYSAESAKYDMRVFLLSLGFIGDEFKTARGHLLALLPGSAAWKNGRPPEGEEGT